ncbi:MAG TPA: hypothetical protein VD905_08785, partial [Flavobacteriales bacterium]|nr:hypothetical protein [Flavobacteriales bacterium]
EFSIFYYLFARKKQVPANAFTYHQKSGKIMTGLFIGIISTETVAVHFLVAKWSVLTAWLLTISSAYVALALVAHYRASARLPILVTNTGMRIQNGLISSTVEIPFKAIKQIHQTTTSGILNHKKVLYVNSMNQLGNHNLVIELTGEFECVGLYGRKTAFNTLALELDDRNLFLATIKNKQLL